MDTVDEFRGKFPKWHQEIPFHLQRLGRQYQNKPKKERQGKAAATGANSELPQDKSDAEMEANQSDSDTVENEAVGEKQEDKTDVEMKSAEEKALTTAGKPNEAKMEERKKPKFTSAVVDSVIKEELSKVKVPSKKQLKKKMKAKEKKPAEKSQPIIPALPVLPEVKR